MRSFVRRNATGENGRHRITEDRVTLFRKLSPFPLTWGSCQRTRSFRRVVPRRRTVEQPDPGQLRPVPRKSTKPEILLTGTTIWCCRAAPALGPLRRPSAEIVMPAVLHPLVVAPSTLARWIRMTNLLRKFSKPRLPRVKRPTCRR
jgi:hypothetical protein